MMSPQLKAEIERYERKQQEMRDRRSVNAPKRQGKWWQRLMRIGRKSA